MKQTAGDDFIWTQTNGRFNFSSGIAAFGMQFGSASAATSSVTLNGFNSGNQVGGSFFGIISMDNTTFTHVSYAKSLNHGALDDVTYSAQVSAPIDQSNVSDIGGAGTA
jgi:hypothetical protein